MHKLIPPAQDDIKSEHRDLYKNGDMKPVASYANEHPSTFSRKLNPEEETKDHLHEIIMELYGTVMSGKPEIGRGLLEIINRRAVEFGLSEATPVETVMQAIEDLKPITLEQLEQMSPEDRFAVQGHAADLEEEAKRVKKDAIAAKNTGQTHAREFSRAGAGGSGGLR